METKISEFEDDNEFAPSSDHRLVLDVDGFAGPIDVLLTLAREQKVDLTQISILELADQYLVWVAKLRQANLELAADYLVMAAWLAYLKSILLLPTSTDDEEPTGEEMAAALQFQLLRLESMQQAGEKLLARDQLGQDFFPRGNPEKFGYNLNGAFEASIYDLLKAYGEHTHRSNVRILRIELSDLYSTDDGLKWLTKMLGSMPDWTSLLQFLPAEIKGDLVSRSMVASALSAALQLTKQGELKIRQTETFGTVYVRAAQNASEFGRDKSIHSVEIK
ncbi:MAG TPA: segregation/condensation protein A [Rhodospirillales bacterium]|nr:segregation/condensation protein A [Rhodospirillales bacterium]HIB21916.1 segregation/condensation protein A [Rhodospirillales bacterium]